MSTEPTSSRADAASSAAPRPTSSAEDPRPQRVRPGPGEIAQAQGPSSTARSRAGARTPPPRRRRKARMVHRVVRHVEVWSVAKVMSAFAVCGYVIGMISGYLLWRAADRVGTIDGFEGFMEDSGGYDRFVILGDVVFRSAAIGGAVLAVLFVAMSVLGAVLFNLISDLTGGVRLTAIDEDLIVTPARRPEADPARRPEADPARRPEADPARRPEADPARRPEPTPVNGHAVPSAEETTTGERTTAAEERTSSG